MGTLRDALHQADADAFVGRGPALRTADTFLAPASLERFLLVRGPGGIGKSALLREIGRRGAAAGFVVHLHEAARLDLRALPSDSPLLLLLDEADELGAGVTMLRDTLLDRLPDQARVVIAGRYPPDPGWWRDGLDSIVRELHLDPLPDDEGRALLESRSLTDPGRQREVLGWAHGSPLALVVAAASAGGVVPTNQEAVLEERLATWLAGASIEGAEKELLEVAALTSPVDTRLLAAALPGRNLRAAMSSLWALPVIRREGHGASLHPALATAIATRLRVDNNLRHRELVRRIALHLEGRARLGDHRALLQLTALIEGPQIVSGIARRTSRTHVGDALRPGDSAALALASGLNESPAWAPVEWFLERFPRHTTVVRRADGGLAGMLGGAPMAAIAADGSATAQAIHAVLQDAGCDPARTMVGPAILLETEPERLVEVLRVAYSIAISRSGIADLRHCLTHYPDPTQRPLEFLAVGAWQPVQLGSRDSSWLMDWGPSGAIGFTLDQVLREQGFHDQVGRSSLLATGSEERLAASLGRIFSDTDEDNVLRRSIELAHLSPGLTEREILGDLYVSRATYFRLLRRARERVLAAETES